MLMPVGLKGKARKKYIEANAYKFATAPRDTIPGKRGLKTAGVVEVAPVVEESEDASAIEQTGSEKADE